MYDAVTDDSSMCFILATNILIKHEQVNLILLHIFCMLLYCIFRFHEILKHVQFLRHLTSSYVGKSTNLLLAPKRCEMWEVLLLWPSCLKYRYRRKSKKLPQLSVFRGVVHSLAGPQCHLPLGIFPVHDDPLSLHVPIKFFHAPSRDNHSFNDFVLP